MARTKITNKTPGEQRAYSRGYSAGIRRGSEHYLKIIALAKGWRDMVMRQLGLEGRTCQNCRHWERNLAGAKWGHCDGKFEPPEPWANADTGAPDYIRAKIETAEEFGCVNFKAKEQT